MGQKAKLTFSCTTRLFLLAAVMYVDDMDLIHWANSVYNTDEDLLLSANKRPLIGGC